MPEFEEGNTQGRGRPKGAQNKTTTEARQLMSELLAYGLSKGKDKIDTMSNYDYIAFMTLLAKHTVPVPKEEGAEDLKGMHLKFSGKLLQ